MRAINNLSHILEETPLDLYADDDSISLALVNRLKARIARRESRFKTRVVERAETPADPPALPAA